jgi:hypothetical protein
MQRWLVIKHELLPKLKGKKPKVPESSWCGELRSAGISHPGQPTRLHARCRLQARSSAARIPRRLAGCAFACKRMLLRATNSTQVLFV